MLPGAFQRNRHACRQPVCQLAVEDDAVASGTSGDSGTEPSLFLLPSSSPRPRPSRYQYQMSNSSSEATITDCLSLCCCGSCCVDCWETPCDWLTSLLLFRWDHWLPAAGGEEDPSTPVIPPGASGPPSRTASGADGGVTGVGNRRHSRQSQRIPRDGNNWNNRREGFEVLEGVGAATSLASERDGPERERGGLRRFSSTDDSKPLLSDSASMEFREKERRFVKGRFVMPGSEVQRKIAEAMTDVLAAGGRAMSGSGSDSCSGNSTAPSTNIAHSGTMDSYGYDRFPEEDATAATAADMGEENGYGVSQDKSETSKGMLSCRAAPRRATSLSSEGFYRGTAGSWAKAEGDTGEEKECVICMEEFTVDDPEMRTLCSCGVNKTFFHYSCLLKWLSKHSYCPACRGYLYFEEHRRGSPEERSGNLPGTRGGTSSRRGLASSEDYGEALQRALRAGLSGGGDFATNPKSES